jgi:DNA polymerase sigma
MSQVYQGGIGSYALLVMVASFLLNHKSRMPSKANRNPTLECNLGLLLLDFFRVYGRTLKQEEVAISCRYAANASKRWKMVSRNVAYLEEGHSLNYVSSVKLGSVAILRLSLGRNLPKDHIL